MCRDSPGAAAGNLWRQGICQDRAGHGGVRRRRIRSQPSRHNQFGRRDEKEAIIHRRAGAGRASALRRDRIRIPKRARGWRAATLAMEERMKLSGPGGWIGALVGATLLSLTMPPSAALAQGKTYVMKISLPTLGDPSFVYAHNYAAAIEKDSGGRIKPQIFPASQLGSIPRQIEGTQFGSIQCAILPPEFFVGVDTRFEVMAAPGLVGSLAQGQRVAADPAVLKLMLSLGANKGLHGIAMFMNSPSSVIAKTPIRHLADFKGKKIRVLASPFQMAPIAKLGATPVAMTLADVVPAMQQGTIDGAVGGIVVWTPMHFSDAAKYVTETGQPA